MLDGVVQLPLECKTKAYRTGRHVMPSSIPPSKLVPSIKDQVRRITEDELYTDILGAVQLLQLLFVIKCGRPDSEPYSVARGWHDVHRGDHTLHFLPCGIRMLGGTDVGGDRGDRLPAGHHISISPRGILPRLETYSLVAEVICRSSGMMYQSGV